MGILVIYADTYGQDHGLLPMGREEMTPAGSLRVPPLRCSWNDFTCTCIV